MPVIFTGAIVASRVLDPKASIVESKFGTSANYDCRRCLDEEERINGRILEDSMGGDPLP